MDSLAAKIAQEFAQKLKTGAHTDSPEEERWVREVGHYIGSLRMPPARATGFSKLEPEAQKKYQSLADEMENLREAIHRVSRAFSDVDDV
jgi:hypothetical protein